MFHYNVINFMYNDYTQFVICYTTCYIPKIICCFPFVLIQDRSIYMYTITFIRYFDSLNSLIKTIFITNCI